MEGNSRKRYGCKEVKAYINGKTTSCNELVSTRGITLIALVITIIVLLILAGVSLSMVFNSNGLFNRANDTAKRYNKAKARETLEIAFRDLEIEKYEHGLTTEALSTRITEEVGKMGGTEIGDDKNQVIVDGYIFQVDRSVPKIIQELGQANEVIVTSKVTQNGDWQNPVATVTGTIIKYGGGTVTNVTATATNGVTITGLPTTGGNFTIPNIATDTVITITTTDSSGKTKTHTIEVKLIRDETPPEIKTAEAKANRMKITIKAIAEDKESGITSLRYSITPTTGLPSGQNEGDLPQNGTPVEITSTAEETYTVTITATNGAGNTSTKEITGVATSDAMSVEEAKNTVTSMEKLQEYVGTKVAYKAGETWQIFYYDDTGDFGPSKTLYLKRAYGEVADTRLKLSNKTAESDPAVQMMRQMNPLWRDTEANSKSIDLNSEKTCVWLCDPSVWDSQRNTDYSSFAIGSPSVEMYMKAFNVYKTGNKNANNLIYKIENANGYDVGANTSYDNLGWNTNFNTIEPGPNDVFMTSNVYWCLASPSSYSGNTIYSVRGDYAFVGNDSYSGIYGLCPIIPLDLSSNTNSI